MAVTNRFRIILQKQTLTKLQTLQQTQATKDNMLLAVAGAS